MRPAPASIASRISRTRNATASSAARAICAFVEPRVSPRIAPRASESQCGDPRPASAGINITPPDVSVDAASCDISAAEGGQSQLVPQPLHD